MLVIWESQKGEMDEWDPTPEPAYIQSIFTGGSK
jgi:hypothetical protein